MYDTIVVGARCAGSPLAMLLARKGYHVLLVDKAIDAGLSGRRSLEEALADYERRCNEAVLPMYELTCQLASLEPPSPEMQQFFGALRGNQAEIDRFWGTIAGTVPIPEFFSPRNIERIVTGAELAEVTA